MTEKRFIRRYAGGTIKKLIGIEDIETNRVCITIEENIQLLNELNDENEQLKQSYKEFEDECQSTFNSMSRKQNDLYRKNFKLKEENEQLKQQIKDLRINVLDSIHEADEIKCTCNPCVVEKCVKKVVE